MGVALYVALEREIDGLDSFMGGKALANAPVDDTEESNLADVARNLGVKPLHEFHSADPEQIIGFMFDGDPADAPENIRRMAPAIEWFPASEGLATARALLDYLQTNPNFIPTSEKDRIRYAPGWNLQEGVEIDLQDIVRILEQAKAEGVRWYLGIDC
ncbi:MAG: hypothetical protein ABIY70_21090 [Capsulimonas sp.]|uniref:hypothetical protein n=1 Tax=Capsulimonas sp. TaxID=2494211 RepID=UPI003266BE12